MTLESNAEAQDKAKETEGLNIQLLRKIYDTTVDQNIKKLIEPHLNAQAAPSDSSANEAAPSHSAVTEAILQ